MRIQSQNHFKRKLKFSHLREDGVVSTSLQILSINKNTIFLSDEVGGGAAVICYQLGYLDYGQQLSAGQGREAM